MRRLGSTTCIDTGSSYRALDEAPVHHYFAIQDTVVGATCCLLRQIIEDTPNRITTAHPEEMFSLLCAAVVAWLPWDQFIWPDVAQGRCYSP